MALGFLVGSLQGLACGDGAAADTNGTTRVHDVDVVANCDPAGAGATMGDKVGTVSWTMAGGDAFQLHDGCGKRSAVVLIESALWCVTCIEAAPLIEAWVSFYAPHGVQFVLLVGEDEQTNPATPTHAAQYAAKGHSDLLVIAADPKWATVRKAIKHPDVAVLLPHWTILDKDLAIVYAGKGGPNATFADVPKTLEALTGVPFEAEKSCEGFCGGFSAGGCWCDSTCSKIGDCCENNCDACGNCD